MQKTQIVLVGLGMSGMCMAMQLLRHGIHDFIFLEKTGTCGGTWAQNIYPGVECDVESHLYSFSFEPHDWERVYSHGRDIQKYLETCFQKYHLENHGFFYEEVKSIQWQESNQTWRVLSTTYEFECHHVVVSVAPLHVPHRPWEGMHTAEWTPETSFEGKCVAVVGNAASGVQCLPHIVQQAKQVYLFQRTPNWIVPKWNRPYTRWERQCLRVPWIRTLYRNILYVYREFLFMAFWKGSWLGKVLQWISTRYIQRNTPPHLHHQLIPTYPFGCKRVLLSEDYLSVFHRSNVHLVAEPIVAIKNNVIFTQDGTQYPCEEVVLATGFQILGSLSRITILGKQGISLDRDRTRSSNGVLVDGFPGLFLLLGPFSGSAHTSILLYIEAQVEFILNRIQRRGTTTKTMDTGKLSSHSFHDMVWSQCNSWYQHDTLYPGFSFQYRQQLMVH